MYTGALIFIVHVIRPYSFCKLQNCGVFGLLDTFCMDVHFSYSVGCIEPLFININSALSIISVRLPNIDVCYKVVGSVRTAVCE